MGDICVSNALQVSSEMNDIICARCNIVLFTWRLAFMASIIFALLDVVSLYMSVSTISGYGSRGLYNWRN